jgi:hypothetical protein
MKLVLKTKVAIIISLSFVLVGCEKKGIDYFPLKEGLNKVYFVKQSDEEGKLIETILPTREVKGKKVTPKKVELVPSQKSTILTAKTLFAFYYVDETGIHEYGGQEYEAPEPTIEDTILLKFPFKVGTSWQVNSKEKDNKTIVSTNDTVDVKAGTFRECIKVKIREDYEWYAPNIGLVKLINNSLNIFMELESYSQTQSK